jgi:hypothetical protein
MKTYQKRQRPLPNQSTWGKIWRDPIGNVVLWQTPNVLLITWAIVTFVSLFVPNGIVESIFYWVSELLLGVWAVLEIWKGIDYLRRALGLYILIFVILAGFHLF